MIEPTQAGLYQLNAPISSISEVIASKLLKRVNLKSTTLQKKHSYISDKKEEKSSAQFATGQVIEPLEKKVNNYNGIHYPEPLVPAVKCIKVACTNLKEKIEQTNAVIAFYDLPQLRMSHNDQVTVFEHLIDNAIKYAKKGTAPLIHVGAECFGSDIIISISDNGIGIPKQMFGSIFGLFTKVYGNTEGQGIGLSLVKNIIESYNGSVWVESNNKKGSTFFYSLGL